MIVVTEEELELYHSGIKGMKWGIRRYQNPDGSLTEAGRKRYMKNPRWRKKYIKYKMQEAMEKKKAAETREERRKRLLESSDANEIYKHRNELTTSELKDRIDRIRTEQDLAKYVTKEPTRMDKAKEVVNKIADAGDKAIKFANTPMGKEVVKQIKAQMGIATESKNVNYDKELRRIAQMTNDEVRDLATRIRNEQSIRRIADELRDGTNNHNNSNNNTDTRSESQRILEALDDNRINITDWEARDALERYLRENPR